MDCEQKGEKKNLKSYISLKKQGEIKEKDAISNIHNVKWFWNFAFMQNIEHQAFVISEYRITNIRSVYLLSTRTTGCR
jgi:hypothetical protein